MGKRVVPVEEVFAVLGRHFARTVLEDINRSDGSSVDRVVANIDHLLAITRRELLAELAKRGAVPPALSARS